MARTRVVYDRNMQVMAFLPEGVDRVDLGRETYDGIPVPMSPRRMKGDGTKIEALFKHFTADQRKEMIKQLHGISRLHAVLSIAGEDVLLRDAGSRNGVTLKAVGIGGADRKLAGGESCPLRNGTVFTLGAWPLLFLDIEGDIAKLRRDKPKVYVVPGDGGAPPA